MSKSERKNILISEPNALSKFPHAYLPYMWAILKSFCEHENSNNDCFNWLDPVYQNEKVSSVLQPYDSVSIDILGLSCYIWNWDLQRSIARQVKSKNHDCLVIAGGPQPDYKSPDFFQKYPYIDIAITQDGEIPFSKILKKLAQGEKDFADIPGLYLPTQDRKGNICTGMPELPVKFDYSPYITQSAYFEKLIKSQEDGGFNAVWETNRGCPYDCSYCYWGSNIMSRIRAFEMDRVEAEAEWFGEMKVNCTLLADANFGILPRDIEIIDLIIAARKKYDHPKNLFYCATKSDPMRNVEIAKRISKSELTSVYQLAFQHTRREVLESIDRTKISLEKQKEAAKSLMDDDILFNVALLLGLPGDTYDQWKSCLTDVMEWGIHDNYTILPFILLPNSPAAEKSYIDEYQVETTLSCAPTDVGGAGRIRKGSTERLIKGDIIVKTKTFSKEDWVKMKTYASYVKALHNCGITQNIAIYLRFTHNIKYKEFYETLIEHFADSNSIGNELYQTILESNKKILMDENAKDFLVVKQLPDFQYLLEGYQWIFTQICFNFERFFDELRIFMLEKYPIATNLESVINYQKNLVILPNYDKDKGKVFPTDFDWIQYFKKAKQLTKYEPLPEPGPVPRSVIKVSDQYCGSSFAKFQLDWNSDSWENKAISWIESTLLWQRSSLRNNYQNLSLQKL